MNGIVIARGGTAEVVTPVRPAAAARGRVRRRLDPRLSRRRRSATSSTLSERVAARAVEVLGLRDGIAFPQLIAHPDGSVAVVEVAARIPGGQMADLVRHATGRRPRRARPALCARRAGPGRRRAAALLAAARDPVPDRRARAAARRDGWRGSAAWSPCSSCRGRRPGRVVPAGRRDDPPGAARRRPPRVRDRGRGHVLSRRSTEPRRPRELLESRSRRELRLRSRALPRAARRSAGGRLSLRPFGEAPAEGDLFLRHDVDLSLDAALRMAELEHEPAQARPTS